MLFKCKCGKQFLRFQEFPIQVDFFLIPETAFRRRYKYGRWENRLSLKVTLPILSDVMDESEVISAVIFEHLFQSTRLPNTKLDSLLYHKHGAWWGHVTTIYTPVYGGIMQTVSLPS